MMTSTLVHAPSRQPMRDIMDMAIAAETSGAVLNASVFGGFPTRTSRTPPCPR